MKSNKQALIFVCTALFLLVATGPIQAQSVTPNNLSFTDVFNGAGPATQTLTLTDKTTFTATASTQDGGSWLSINPSSGSGNNTITVMATTGTLAAGTYRGTIVVKFQDDPVTNYNVGVTFDVVNSLMSFTG